jgi:hypothetical protein
MTNYHAATVPKAGVPLWRLDAAPQKHAQRSSTSVASMITRQRGIWK